jgi:hypothetical protein
MIWFALFASTASRVTSLFSALVLLSGGILSPSNLFGFGLLPQWRVMVFPNLLEPAF